MKKILAGFAMAAFAATSAFAAGNSFQINGQGTLTDGRVFAVNARIDQDGDVSGRATLINTAFSGDSGRGPFRAHIDISCINIVGGEIYLGGLARSNDSNLDGEAVFFAVNSSGSQLSSAFFWDGDPNTTGVPANCEFNLEGDFPLNNVVRGNINVH